MRCCRCGEEIVLRNNENVVTRHEMIVDGVGKSAQYWHGACYDATHDAVGNYAGELRVKKEPWRKNFTPPMKENDDG